MNVMHTPLAKGKDLSEALSLLGYITNMFFS